MVVFQSSSAHFAVEGGRVLPEPGEEARLARRRKPIGVAMHAIEVTQTGGPDVLTYVERPIPTPSRGQVLINAEAIGVNFIDTYFRSGLYPHELPFVIGSEVCGMVAAVGEDVASVRVGDRVASADAAGTYAEYCLTPVGLTAVVPDQIPLKPPRRRF